MGSYDQVEIFLYRTNIFSRDINRPQVNLQRDMSDIRWGQESFVFAKSIDDRDIPNYLTRVSKFLVEHPQEAYFTSISFEEDGAMKWLYKISSERLIEELNRMIEFFS